MPVVWGNYNPTAGFTFHNFEVLGMPVTCSDPAPGRIPEWG